jgi:hypothetical protein
VGFQHPTGLENSAKMNVLRERPGNSSLGRRTIMSDSVREKINADFSQVKSEGGTRASRIREIFQNAAAQAVGEIKEGSGTIGTIAKGTLFTVAENMNGQASEPAATPEKDMSFKAVMTSLFKAIQHWVVTQATQEYAEVKQQVATWDGKLDEQYGDRYATLKQGAKQGAQTAKTWYTAAKTKAETLDTDVLKQKQTEFRGRVSEAGSSVAKTEQVIRKQLKEMLQTVGR